MPSPPGSNTERRLLVAVGTENYDHDPGGKLSQVPVELRRLVTRLSALGYEQVLQDISRDPSSEMLRQQLSTWCKKKIRDGDLLVLYYTGHGVRDSDRFYLLTRDSDVSNLDSTAVPVQDLARWVTKDSRAAQVLVILDACYSGAGAAELAQIASQLAVDSGSGPAVFVIAAARPKQEADQGALSHALDDALANTDGRMGGLTQQYLNLDEVMEAVDQYLRVKNPAQTATWGSTNVRGRCRLFRNPRYDENVPVGLDLESQKVFREHWVPKAMGAESAAGAWYFTGRQRALAEIVAWLAQEHPAARAMVVTGGAGCGKSALLARVVTLADPAYRAAALSSPGGMQTVATNLPPEGIVDVAILARRKLLTDVVKQIASKLSITAEDPQTLVAAIAKRAKRTVIVVDALDEADERDAIVLRLLQPLMGVEHVRLLVGTRPDSVESGRRFRALGETETEIDLDSPAYLGTSDISDYVAQRLLATLESTRRTPYRGQSELARTVANAVATKCQGVFLVARTVTEALLAAPQPVDLSRPNWVDALPLGIDEAFAQFFAGLDRTRVGGLSAARARALLLPLAYAEGEGLPWGNLWAPVARARGGTGDGRRYRNRAKARCGLHRGGARRRAFRLPFVSRSPSGIFTGSAAKRGVSAAYRRRTDGASSRANPRPREGLV